MNKLKLGLAIVTCLAVTSCGITPFKRDIADGKFRLESFHIPYKTLDTRIYLMCNKKKPVGWAVAKQYPAGKHSLWVKVDVKPRSMGYRGQAHINFEMEFEAGKNYRLNKKADGRNITVWIEEKDTGIVKSKVITTYLHQPMQYGEKKLRLRQCQRGTI